MRPLTLLGLCGTMLMAAGCRNSILFTTSSMIGVELNATEGASQSAKVGYLS